MKWPAIVVITVIVVIGIVAALAVSSRRAEAPTTTPAASDGRVMSIESYITQRISELSPERAVLGGTFYVTAIEAEGGKGTVSYEDGHNAYTADFTYEINDRTGIVVKSFVIRK